MKKYSTYIIIALSCLIAGFSLSFFRSCNRESESQTVQKIVLRDTIRQIVPSEPIVLTKVKTQIRTVRDTLILTKPFVASLDTVIKTDTISTKFAYPENVLSLLIKRRPDTLQTERIILQNEKTESKEAWWVKPAIFIAGGVIGLLVNRSK